MTIRCSPHGVVPIPKGKTTVAVGEREQTVAHGQRATGLHNLSGTVEASVPSMMQLRFALSLERGFVLLMNSGIMATNAPGEPGVGTTT